MPKGVRRQASGVRRQASGVRRQPTYSSRFDYGLPLIYLTGKFNSLNSLDRLKKINLKN